MDGMTFEGIAQDRTAGAEDDMERDSDTGRSRMAGADADAQGRPTTARPAGEESPVEPTLRSKTIVHTAQYERDQVGSLMERPIAVLAPDTRVADAVDEIRILARRHFITYVYVTDDDNQLEGVVAMRELLLADADQTLSEIMLRDPYALRADMTLLEAMREAVGRHYPVYPVCDRLGRLVGLVRGQAMFERQAIEISAQPGQMVGVEKEETMATPWPRCFRLRYPWLQFNLVAALAAASVVALFQSTIDQLVLLAAFLPMLSAQAGNTGAQAMAVTLRGITLGEVRRALQRVRKEALLGVMNGVPVGISAALVMYVYATVQDAPVSLMLGIVVFVAMTLSCVLSGMIGAGVPLLLRRLGADPATASSILLSTTSDVISMGLLLSLTAWLVL